MCESVYLSIYLATVPRFILDGTMEETHEPKDPTAEIYIYLSICLSSICLSVCLSICLYICISICLHTYPPS